jgi:hypothetical protein
MRSGLSISTTIILLIMGMGFFYEAEAKTIDAGHATVSWKGKGVIDDLGMGTEFLAALLPGPSS